MNLVRPSWLPSAVIAIVALTVIVRLGIMVLTDSYARPHVGEVDNIAIAIASGRGFADAYAPNTGPTTHYTPGQPLLIAICYILFGINADGEFARQIQRIIFSCLLFGSLPVVALRLGLSARVGMLAGLAGAILPLHILQELRGSGAILDSLFIAAFALNSFSFWQRPESFSPAAGSRQGLLLGIACLFNPVIVALAAGFGLYAFYRFPVRRRAVLLHYAAAAVITVLCLLPWAFYNHHRMGRFVLIRGNFPLEMSLSFHPKAEVLLKDAWQVPGAYPHPSADPVQSARVRALGESAYMDEKKQEVIAFVRDNPGQVASLITGRIFRFWFSDNGRFWQNLGFWGLTLGALTGFGLLVRGRHPTVPLFGLILLFFPLVYYLQMADTQYRLPIYWVFLLLFAIPIDAALTSFDKEEEEGVHS
jgi:hypothetical protein